MKSALTLTLAAMLASTAPMAPAFAQPTYEQQQYERQMRDYEAQQRDYEARRRDYEAAQRDYDRRYGAGAYARYNGAFAAPPQAPRYAGPNDDPYRPYADNACERRNANARNRDANRFAGGLIGALAGAAIGSNIASDNARDEGAVLGAFAGAALGVGIAGSAGSSRSTALCDGTGYYYTYDQTYPYQEPQGARGRRSGRYDQGYYSRQRCRLAVAPAYMNGRSEYRYVRVCPDRQGRYRITS